jgi:hypothetical protein
MISCLLSCCFSETTIGIIIGSCFTLVGVFANGVVTYFLNRDTHNREVKERKRCEQKKEDDEKRVKRERVYREFVNFYSFMNLFVGLAYATKGNLEGANILGSLYQEKIKENFSKAAETTSDVLLYGSSAIAKMCQEYQDFWNAESQKGFPVEDFVKLDQELANIVNAMKKELELDNL